MTSIENKFYELKKYLSGNNNIDHQFENGNLSLFIGGINIILKRASNDNIKINVKITDEEGNIINLAGIPSLDWTSKRDFEFWLKDVLKNLKQQTNTNFYQKYKDFWQKFNPNSDIPNNLFESFDKLDKFLESTNTRLNSKAPFNNTIIPKHLTKAEITELENQLRKVEEEIKSGIDNNHPNKNIYYGKGKLLYLLGRYEDALDSYDKAIELSNLRIKSEKTKESLSILYDIQGLIIKEKGIILIKMGKEKEAKEAYKKSIMSLNESLRVYPEYHIAYYSKWLIFMDMGNKKLSDLNMFVASLIAGRTVSFDNEYKKEEDKIKGFIEKKDFESLRTYLLSLEEKL